MHNLIILGSGRSGTSMVAGLFRNSGYFMGETLHEADRGNPKGYFEDVAINSLNERILMDVLPRRPRGFVGNWFFSARPGTGQMWLARVPVGTPIVCSEEIKSEIRQLTAKEPYCFKDPRFSYTLPCWKPFLRGARFLVVFRHPADTAKSIAKECQAQSYLRTLAITRADMLEGWTLMYDHILRACADDGTWQFVHYNQALTADGLNELERFSSATVDRSFPDENLRRSVSTEPVPAETRKMYGELCRRAGYDLSADEVQAAKTA
jgi:hypothetical protein